MMKKPKYLLYIAMCRAEEGTDQYEVLFRMIGKVPRARVDGQFRSPTQMVDHFKVAEATGGTVELSIQLDNISEVLHRGDVGDEWKG